MNINVLLTDCGQKLNMTKHIINLLRKTIAGAVLLLLPIRKHSLNEPEPIRRTNGPRSDAWLFDNEQSVTECKEEYFDCLASLSTMLGDLERIIPMPVTSRVQEASYAQFVPVKAILSDSFLFEGEVKVQAEWPAQSRDTEHAFLFEGTPDARLFDRISPANRFNQVTLRHAA